eukprot:365153-Chlamydomonas_euryale.AAC.4
MCKRALSNAHGDTATGTRACTCPQVLAGALQDNGRATIAGESRTFGKGLIQTVVDLSDGSGVAITVARYQTPLGTDINKVGIHAAGDGHQRCRYPRCWGGTDINKVGIHAVGDGHQRGRYPCRERLG